MIIFLYALIIIFGTASYIVGVWQMIKNKYSPSTFSRVVWVLLSINSFAGVVLSNGTKSSIILGIIFLLGNIAICLASFWKGTREIGGLELFCLFLLFISGLIWVFFEAPLLNLGLSLFAHFVGGIPTYKKVWLNPKSESVGFWSLFFIASLLSIFVSVVDSNMTSLSAILFPIYFTIFDGGMTLLSLRKSREV